MSFPTKLRDILGAEFYLCAGHDDSYIAVYSPAAFEEYRSKLYSVKGSIGSAIRRKFLSSADKQIPDKQGRIFITQQLREHAGITKDVVSVGVVNKIEIWSKERWDANNTYDSVDDIADHMSEFGLSF